MNFFSLGNILKKGFILALLCMNICLLPGSASAAALPGDCNLDGVVKIAEVRSALNMYLGLETVATCVDTDNNLKVSLNEVQKTVNMFLGLTPTEPALPVTGAVKDTSNKDAAVSSVVVKAYVNGTTTPAATVTAASNGTFSVSGLLDGRSYYFVFSKTGYADVTYYGINPSKSANTVLEAVRMLTSSVMSQTADINGYIQNAANNTGLYNIKLDFRAGINAREGEPLALSKSTTSNGSYAKSFFPAGVYTAEVIDKSVPEQFTTLGYFTVYAVPGVPAYNNSQNCAVAIGTSPAENYRVVLSWGNSPLDLDFHLTGPLAPGDVTTTLLDDTPRFHIGAVPAMTHMTYPYDSAVPWSSVMPDVYLDIDQADHGTDNGSETLTILTQRTGVYRFYVYNNSPVGGFNTSGGQVKVYKGTTLLHTFLAPISLYNTWKVFELDGTTITPLNTATNVNDYAQNLAKSVPGTVLEEQLLFKPVLKAPRY